MQAETPWAVGCMLSILLSCGLLVGAYPQFAALELPGPPGLVGQAAAIATSKDGKRKVFGYFRPQAGFCREQPTRK